VVNYWFLKQANEDAINEPVYYFRLLEPDFTRMPAFDSLAAYATSGEAAAVEANAEWTFGWMGVRPYLNLIGGSLLFLWLLWFLSKESTG
jgi:hypothetical protein